MKPRTLMLLLVAVLSHATATTSKKPTSFPSVHKSAPAPSAAKTPTVSKPNLGLQSNQKPTVTLDKTSRPQAPKSNPPRNTGATLTAPGKPASVPAGTTGTKPTPPKVVYFSTKPQKGFEHYFQGRYYPHPYKHYKAMGWLALLDAAQETPELEDVVLQDPQVAANPAPREPWSVVPYDEKRTEMVLEGWQMLKPVLLAFLGIALALGVFFGVYVLLPGRKRPIDQHK